MALLCFLHWELSEDVVLLPRDLFNILAFSGTGGFVALLELFWTAPSSCISKSCDRNRQKQIFGMSEPRLC